MAATAGKAIPIKVWRIDGTNGGFPPARRLGENATQTFFIGTPVQMVTGYAQACPAITSVATALIAGFSVENASNLTTAGVAQTQNLTTKVQNQPSAVITAIGAPPNDGTVGFIKADDNTNFIGIVGGSTNGGNATAASDVGSIFGLTQDATTKFWYIDKDITAVSSGACVQVTELIDPAGTANGREAFRVLSAAMQFTL